MQRRKNMADNKNIDPLEALLNKQKAALGRPTDEPVATSTDVTSESTGFMNTEIPVNEVASPLIPDDITEDDIYGNNDLENEIAAEEAADAAQRKAMAEEAISQKEQKKAETPFMPPDEHDMQYHNEAIAYQQDKLNIVSGMVNRVVAKYRIISGGIEDVPNPDLGTLGKMAVMGELIDIYHNNGEKITPEFENLILKNWVMPDGSLAINNINENGIVIDRTMTSDAPTNVSSTKITNDVPTEEKKETPTININVEQGTPVTVNVDDSIVAKTAETNEVNIYVKEVTQEELLKTTIVENSDQEGIINVYDSGVNDVPITLPLSGYRCVMRPINWFDFIKLTAPTSNNGTDNELKKWSVIYDHLKNPSIGEFKDFEDFMKKTKYQDREILMWGLLVATADDEETLSFTCDNENCKNRIQIKYRPRTIIHIDDSHVPSWYLPSYESAPGPDSVKIWEEANGRRKRYKLPNTGIIVEINEPSAYEYVTQKLPLIDTLFKRYRPDDSMTKLDPQDVSMAEFDYLAANALFVSAMTIVRQGKDGKPKEYRFTNWNQIEEIITKALDAEDSGILLKIIEKTRENVSPVSFRVEDITCKSCGRHIDFVPINDIGTSLLFQVSRRLSNTQINLIEMD
jgi:hypothetical protein